MIGLTDHYITILNVPRSQSAACNADLTSAMGAPVCSRNCLMRAMLLGAAANKRNPNTSPDAPRLDADVKCKGLMPLRAFNPSIVVLINFSKLLL